jgi:enoyl-CoA hydratase
VKSRDIDIRIEGKAGRITLSRPHALNALTYAMAMAIESAIDSWLDNDDVSLVVLDAEGDRAFCAGGDVEELYRRGRSGDLNFARRFWVDEYRMNAKIAEFPKPVVAFMQGFVMGGGVGVGCHASHRILCDTTRVAMPECAIGLVPDVGGSWLLARAPGRLGEYYAITGERMGPRDALHAGFADHFVPLEIWPHLVRELCAGGDASVISAAARETGDPPIVHFRADIDNFFGRESALDCLHALEDIEAQWPAETASAIRRGCPISVACAFELIRMNRNAADLRAALANELRFTWRSVTEGEFLEGVRAQVIDKDRKPAWRMQPLESISRNRIEAMLAPLDQEKLDRLYARRDEATGGNP